MQSIKQMKLPSKLERTQGPSNRKLSKSIDIEQGNTTQKFKDVVKMVQYGQRVSILIKQKSKDSFFSIRIRVQMRIADIISTDIAGQTNDFFINEHNNIEMIFHSLKRVSNKWIIPFCAVQAFQLLCFKVLFFIGEHNLSTDGSDALFNLNSLEFHALFGPFIASMGGQQCMQTWLESTNVLVYCCPYCRTHKRNSCSCQDRKISDTLHQINTSYL